MDISIIIYYYGEMRLELSDVTIPHIHVVNTSVVVGSKSDDIESKQNSICFKLQYIKFEIWIV